MAAQANTAEELERKLYDLLNSVKAEPIVLGEYGIYTYGTLKPTIMAYLYSPANYPMPALYLDSLLTRNVTQFSQYIQANLPSTAPSTTPFPDIAAAGGQENTQGIRCSDEALRASNLSDMMPLVEDWYSESKFGDTAMIYHGIACAKWRFQAKERYTGGFEEIVTKNPMLVVANSFDPITSKAGARNASAAFPGSRVLINGGHGHSLISQPSHCTVRAINAYFLDGSLPENGTFCPASVSTFTTKTIQEVLASFDEADD